jgi:hypothetical protein
MQAPFCKKSGERGVAPLTGLIPMFSLLASKRMGTVSSRRQGGRRLKRLSKEQRKGDKASPQHHPPLVQAVANATFTFKNAQARNKSGFVTLMFLIHTPPRA